MPMVPFAKFDRATAEAEIRNIHVVDSPSLPGGLPADDFALMESYCDEPDCDCRRVM